MNNTLGRFFIALMLPWRYEANVARGYSYLCIIVQSASTRESNRDACSSICINTALGKWIGSNKFFLRFLRQVLRIFQLHLSLDVCEGASNYNWIPKCFWWCVQQWLAQVSRNYFEEEWSVPSRLPTFKVTRRGIEQKTKMIDVAPKGIRETNKPLVLLFL